MARDSKCGDKLLCYLLDQVLALYPALAPLPSPRLTPDLAIILSLAKGDSSWEKQFQHTGAGSPVAHPPGSAGGLGELLRGQA